MPRILLVEDNEMNRDMLSRRLERKGFEVVIAVNGPEGLAMARSGRFDLILMDLSLPGIDGWEATRRLKADPATRPVPVIALTAHAMSGDREKAIEAGADDYDIKPVDFPRLLARIETLLAARGPSRPEGPESPDAVSLLRHDLVTPLGRIMGYCELLIEDAEPRGRIYRVQALRSIRSLVKQALGAIDGALLHRRELDPAGFELGVIAPCRAILRALEVLEETSGQAPDRDDFLEDLARLRQDVELTIHLIREIKVDLVK